MALFYVAIRYCFAKDQPAMVLPGLFKVLLLPDFCTIIPFLSHSWGLSIEWQFYIVWPFALGAMILADISRRMVAAIAIALVVVIWIARWLALSDIRIDGLLLGAALMSLVRGGHVGRSGQRFEQPLLARLLVMVTLVYTSDYAQTWLSTSVGYTAMPILCVALLALLYRSDGLADRFLLRKPVLVYLGQISYGLYLYHFPVAALIYIHGYPPVASAIAGVAVCVPISDFSWRYIEQPLLNLGRARRPFALAAASVIERLA